MKKNTSRILRGLIVPVMFFVLGMFCRTIWHAAQNTTPYHAVEKKVSTILVAVKG